MKMKMGMTLLAAALVAGGSYADNFGTGLNAFTLDFVDIGGATNVADTSGYGAVGYTCRIGQKEVTIGQFTKAQAASGNTIGDGNENWFNTGGRTVGTNAPASNVSWLEAARFSNWLSSSDVNTGVYQFSGGSLAGIDRSYRNGSGIAYVLPSEDEWYKAAYYKPADDGSYSLFANGISLAAPTWGGSFGWNYLNGSSQFAVGPPDYAWETGAGGTEQNGTRNMMGNVWEWTESAFDGSTTNMAAQRVLRGGGFGSEEGDLRSSSGRLPFIPTFESGAFGFRVAAIGGTTSWAGEFVIQSFDSTGRLTLNEISTAETYRVEWRTNLLAGVWSSSAPGIAAVSPTGSGTLTVTVGVAHASCFYRVVATVTNTPPAPPSGMVAIPAGTNTGTDPYFGAYSLTVGAFYMDQYEVTKAKWDEVYAWAITNGYSFDNPGSGKAANHPVQMVSWYDAARWCNARSEKEGRTPCYNPSSWFCDTLANGYRLPTNKEREYAARGGLSSKRFPWGDRIDHTRANYRALWSEGSPSYPYDDGYVGPHS